MQTRRTRRFRPAVSTPTPAAPAAPASDPSPPLSDGFAARERPRRSALGGDKGRIWRVLILLVLAAVAFRPLDAFCRFVAEECRKVAVAAGFARRGGEVAQARPLPFAEAARAREVPAAPGRTATVAGPNVGTAAAGGGTFSGAFRNEAVNPFPRVGGGTVAPGFAAAGGFAATDRRAPVVQMRGGAVPNAAGQSLVVDPGNSPYAVTASDTFDSVTVGNNGVGVLNHSAGTLTVGDSNSNGLLYVGNAAGSNGTYNLSGTGSLISNAQANVGAAGTGLFHQTGGTATFNDYGLVVGLSNGGNGTYQLDAGSVQAAQVIVGYSYGSTGTILQNGGTVSTNGNVLVLGENSGSSGSYTLGGTGSQLSTGAVTVGFGGKGVFTQNGGTFVASELELAYLGSSSGSYTLGGTGSQLSTGSVVVGSGGKGFFTQNGGTFTVSSGNNLTLGQYSDSQGSFNLNGGTLSTPAVNGGSSSGGSGTSAFNFNGGTLQAASTTNFVSGLTTANVRNGGAVIDTQAFNVTVAQALTHSTLGTPGATGTITSAGSGYTSAPTVTVTGGGGYGATAVATINAQGQVTGVTLTNPGTNYTGAPTFTFSGGGGTGAAATDGFMADNATDGGLTKLGTGTLTLAGTNTYTGQTTVTAGTLAIPSGVSIGVTGGQANLFVAGTAANAPTLNVSGGSVTAGVVRLGNNTGEVGTITQSAGTVTINGSNGSGQGLFVGYNVNDTGLYALTGGSLALNTASYVGVFGNGTVNQSGGTVAVSGSVLSLGTYNGGNGTYNLSGTGSLSGGLVIVGGYAGSGTGFLHQTGGTLNVSSLHLGENQQGSGAVGTYTLDAGTVMALAVDVGVSTSSTGTVNLNGGTLTTNSVYGLAGTSTVRFNGGTLQASANNTGFVSGFTNAYVGTGGAVINTNGFNVTIASPLSPDPALNVNDGGLTKNGAGTLTMGAQNHFYGPVTVNAGTLRAGANYQAFGQGQSAVTIANAAGATLSVNGYEADIGSLTGGGTTGGTVDLTGGTLDTGNDGTSTTFAGTITGSGGLNKEGVGMFTVTANNTYTGTTGIYRGALMVNNVAAKAGDSGTGSGPVYVGQGAWLGGTGTIGGNVTVGANPPGTSGANGVQPRTVAGSGTLTPGVAVNGVSTPGRLTINGNLTFTSGTSVLEADIAGANAGTGYDQVRVGGSLTLAGTLTLTTGAGFTPTPGEKFFLIDLTGTGTVSGTFDGVAELGTVTDSAGNQYLINYFDHDPADLSNLLLNDVSLTAVPVVPEPSTWALLGLGGAALLGLTVRRACRA